MNLVGMAVAIVGLLSYEAFASACMGAGIGLTVLGWRQWRRRRSRVRGS